MTIGISVKKLSILAQNTAKCRERNGDYGSRIKIRKIFILEAEIRTVRKLLVDPVRLHFEWSKETQICFEMHR